MEKIIQFLVYTFTNRLDKVITFQLNNGIPSEEECREVSLKLKEKYNCNVIVLYSDSNHPNTITEHYIKKTTQ